MSFDNLMVPFICQMKAKIPFFLSPYTLNIHWVETFNVASAGNYKLGDKRTFLLSGTTVNQVD